MATEVVMPQMGADMTEGTLVRWMKQIGDQVQKGDIIAEIETDKAVVELESFSAGVLRRILVKQGESAPVGTVIAIIAGADEELPEKREKPAAPPAEAMKEKGPPLPPRRPPHVPVSPVARQIAEAHGADLTQIQGTGPGGRVVRQDVEAHLAKTGKAAPEPVAPPKEEKPAVIEPSRIRQAIARRMSQSKREIPHYYVTKEVDMTSALLIREDLNAAAPSGAAHITINDMVVKAAALALNAYPDFNGFYVDGRIQRNPEINIGVAVALEEGLVAPAILSCNRKTLPEIAAAARSLIERTRTGAIRSQEYTEATFNISNLGAYDVENFIAIITVPQSAALAVGSVQKRAVIGEDNQVRMAQIMKLTLSADHRVTDGAQGAVFLGKIKEYLEHPTRLLIA